MSIRAINARRTREILKHIAAGGKVQTTDGRAVTLLSAPSKNRVAAKIEGMTFPIAIPLCNLERTFDALTVAELSAKAAQCEMVGLDSKAAALRAEIARRA